VIGPSYTSKPTASLKRTSEGNQEGLLITPFLHVSVLVSAGNRDDRMVAWQLSIGPPIVARKPRTTPWRRTLSARRKLLRGVFDGFSWIASTSEPAL